MPDPNGSYWLLAPDDEPAANLARLIVAANGFEVPIPVEELVAAAAEVEEWDWPYDCDALVVNLFDPGERKVFLKRGLGRRRRRFTLAHELGHIEMAWHVGEVNCLPAESEPFDFELSGAASTSGELLAHHRLREQEAEATRFAAHLLIPDAVVRPAVATGDMVEVLGLIDGLDVSTQAFLLRLKAMLQPGFVFVHLDRGLEEAYCSSGTASPVGAISPDGPVDLLSLHDSSEESGALLVRGRPVHWFRLADYTTFVPSGDLRTSTEILRAVIERHVDEQSHQEVFYSLNGTAGGSLSKQRATSPEQAFGILRHKFDDSRYADVVGDPEFEVYLRRKTEEWLVKRGKRKR